MYALQSEQQHAIAFDRTRATASGDISAPLRACGAATPGVNDAKADAQCVAVSFRGRQGGIAAECETELSPALRSAQGGSDKQFVAYGISNQPTPKIGLEVVPSLDAKESGGGRMECVDYGVSENQRAEIRLTPYSRQITSGGGKPGQGYPAALTQYGVRRLTPVECERLQGFPDDWTTGQSDSKRYKQLGNAVCVPVAEWLGRRIVMAHSS